MNSFKFKAGNIYRRKATGMIFLCLKAEEVEKSGSQYIVYGLETGKFNGCNITHVQDFGNYWEEIK